ncbi:hypothetical protein K0U27_03575 [archaeon]|nr:hypothetical protein [archaeon]
MNMQMRAAIVLLLAAVLIPLIMSDAYAKCIDGEDCRRITGIEPLKAQVIQDVPLSDITCQRYDHILVERSNKKLACLTSDTIERTWQHMDYRYIADYKALLVLEKENLYYDVHFEIRGAIFEGLSFENNSLTATTRPYAEDGALSFQIPYDMLDANSERCNLEIDPVKTSYIAVINDVEHALDYEQDFHGTPVTLHIPLDANSRIIEITHTCQDSQDRPLPVSEDSKNPESCPTSFSPRCFTGTVTEILDGDTVRVDHARFGLALISSSQLDEQEGQKAKAFLESICPVGSDALVDQDNLRPFEGLIGSGRILGVVYCDGLNLNEELVGFDSEYFDGMYCHTSEFADESWSRNGCTEWGLTGK